MQLSLLTTLATFAASATIAEGLNWMPKLRGADQLADIEVEAHCEGCQPDYCYDDPLNFACYKYVS